MEKVKKYFNTSILIVSIILFITLTFIINLDLGTGHKELESVILIAMPCLIFFITSFNIPKDNRKKILIIYLVCYSVILLGFIFSNNRSNELIINGIISKDGNLIPFHSIKELLHSRLGLTFGLYNIIGNFLMLTPLSILLPLIFDKLRKLRKMFWILIIISFTIEISQYLLKLGSFDIDDIILNTSGAFIIFLIFNCTKLYDVIYKLFYEVKIKKIIKEIIYWIFVIISVCFIISRMILIVKNYRDNHIDFSRLYCVQNNEIYLARIGNYYYCSKCDYGNNFIKVGDREYSIKDFIQTKYFKESMIDKLGLFRKEIITNAYLENKIPGKKLLYEDEYSIVYLYQYEKLMVEIDNKLYNFRDLLFNPSSVTRYDMSYLHSLVDLNTINQKDEYSVETGSFFNIVTCGNMYDVYSEIYIIDKSVNDYAQVCR